METSNLLEKIKSVLNETDEVKKVEIKIKGSHAFICFYKAFLTEPLRSPEFIYSYFFDFLSEDFGYSDEDISQFKSEIMRPMIDKIIK